MPVKLSTLSSCAIDCSVDYSVAFYQGRFISKQRFCEAVAETYRRLNTHPQQHFALFYDEAYPFAVMLFALLHAKKQIWIAPNNKQATADYLTQKTCCLLGDWQGKGEPLSDTSTAKVSLTPLDLDAAELFVFTSGSTGEPKAIKKVFTQFQKEIEQLELQWGEQLADAQVLATVSHQHIYGLLFRVLWPLFARRCFHSAMYLSPEPLLKAVNGTAAYWVSSPAQQKRLDELSPWNEMAELNAIFSSGGHLDEAIAENVYKQSRQRIIEVYGSSETGGIAWRKVVDEPRWTFFDGITVKQQGNRFALFSPFLPQASLHFLDDTIEVDEDTLFRLKGRVDRIVKVEEKRLSLDEMEHALCQIDEIAQAHSFLWVKKRDWVVAVVSLTDAGKEALQQQGRGAFIKQCRKQLMARFETVVIPRKWLFVNPLPLTAQGKINQSLITDLLALDNKKFPQLQCLHQRDNTVELSLCIQAELVYFAGHFPEQPILAGVAQLALVEQYGHLFFDIQGGFLQMEVIKFKKVISPNDKVTLTLNWKADTEKLYFTLDSATDSHASGRLVYKRLT